MFKFKEYPIYVAYTRHHQDVMGAGVGRYNGEGDYEGAKFYRNVAMTSEDTAPEYEKEVEDFEKLMRDRLALIERMPLAKMMLERIKNDVWIVPKPTGFPCYCAITGPLDYQTTPDSFDYYEGKGETIIRFDPNDDFKDDTLFHELVHAYRYSIGKFHRRTVGNNEYNSEEFLAHQMQNIYRAKRNLWLLYTYNDGTQTDHPGKWGTKDEIYKHFTTSPDFPMVLRHFVENDPYITAISKLPYPEYNPFRDWKSIERRYIATLGPTDIKSLPPF